MKNSSDAPTLFDTPMNALKREGAFLLAIERAAAAFRRRILNTAGPVRLSRDEALELSDQLERVVSIAQGYHIDATRPDPQSHEPAA